MKQTHLIQIIIVVGVLLTLLPATTLARSRFPQPSIIEDSVTSHSVKVQWEAQSQVKRYQIRVLSSDCSTVLNRLHAKKTRTKKKITGLTASSTYCLRMRAKYRDGTHDAWSTAITVTAHTDLPPIYVTISTHNEEPDSGRYPNFLTDEDAFWEHRAAVLNFATQLNAVGAHYDWQSDWNFLQAVDLYDTGTADTDGKNVVRYLYDDLGVSVDPHAHERHYNYADVAYLISQLGVTPSNVVGGFIAAPANSSEVEDFWVPITATLDSSYTWQAAILWGAGSANHTEDYEVSGVWKPLDNANFLVSSDTAPIPAVGAYQNTWDGVDALLAKQAAGELVAGSIYTANIMYDQDELLDDATVDSALADIASHADVVADGRLIWVTIPEIEQIWEDTYHSEPNIYQ